MVAGTSFLRAIAKEAAPVKALEIINLCQPSQVREFPYGQLELFHIAGQVIGRATYQPGWRWTQHVGPTRSEEHTSELQSRGHLVCRLLLEKKKNNITLL